MEIVSYSRRRASGPGEPGRMAWVDTAKGICIVLVVMMHSTLGTGAEMGGHGFMHWVVAFARPFRMPDFFLVSGLFLSRVIDRDWRSFADKRVVHFAYFYVLWLVIQSGFKYGQLSGGSPAEFARHIAVSLIEPYSTLWFIYILAIFSAATKLLRRVSPQVLLAAATSLQILPIETPSFLLNEFCDRWVYFLAGYMFAPQVFRIAGWASRRVGSGVALLCGWAFVNGVLALTPTGYPAAPTLAEMPLVALALGLAGALAIVIGASMLTRTATALPFRYCGEHSIAIYLAFFLPMAATRAVLVRTGIVSDIGVASVMVTAAGVILPLVIERLFRGTPLGFVFRRPAWAHLSPARHALRLQTAA